MDKCWEAQQNPEARRTTGEIPLSLTKTSGWKFQGCRSGLGIRKGLLIVSKAQQERELFLWGGALPGPGFKHTALPREGPRDSAVPWGDRGLLGAFLALRPRDSTVAMGKPLSPPGLRCPSRSRDGLCHVSHSPGRGCLCTALRFADERDQRGTGTPWRLRLR